MDDTLQQIVEQPVTIEHKQADTDKANTSPTIQKARVLAGTSDGLLFLDSRQHLASQTFKIQNSKFKIN